MTQSAGLAGLSGARFAAWGDVDADGTPDLYVGTAAGPKLFVNQANATFVETATRSGLGHTAADLDAHFLDYDRDTHLDLHVQTAAGDLIYRGVGAGQFERVELGLPAAGASGAPVVAHAPRRGRSPGGPGRGPTRPAVWAAAAPLPAGPPPARERTHRPQRVSPAPGAPGTYSSVPCAFVNASASSVFDQTTNQCLLASSQGTIGNLYPLSNDFNVDAAGNVGIGTTSQADRLHVDNGDIRVSGTSGRELLIEDGSGANGFRMDSSSTGSSNVFTVYQNGSSTFVTTMAPEGAQLDIINSVTSQSVLDAGISFADDSGFVSISDKAGATILNLDGDSGGATSSNGLISVRSVGTGGPGGAARRGQQRRRGALPSDRRSLERRRDARDVRHCGPEQRAPDG